MYMNVLGLKSHGVNKLMWASVFDNKTQDPDSWFYRRAKWKYCRAWLPHRCSRSKKWIWLRRAYCGTVYYEHLQERMSNHKLIMEQRWFTVKEWFLISLTINTG